MLGCAVELAKQAGRLLASNFGKELKIDKKSRHDIKLEMDRRCDQIIIKGLEKHFPSHAILSEEAGATASDSPYEWIVDPLDGTVNYSRAIPHFCTSIAMRKEGQMTLGVVYDPMRDELFTAERGKGARIASAHGGSTRLAVSAARELRDSVLSCGFTKDAETVKRGAETLPVLAGRVSKMRITGSAALDLAYVACGRFDAYFQYGIHLWDVAASSLLLEEAGGKWEILRELKPYCYDYMASNGTLQDELRPLITK